MRDIQFKDFLVALGQTIKQLRKEKGLTQGVIADRIDKPQSTIARFESPGTNDCHLSLVFHLCQAIEADIPTVMMQTLAQLGSQKRIREGDIEARWRVAYKKGQLIKGEKKKRVVNVVEGILELVD